MHITLDALKVLDAIDHLGSFAAAARNLHRVPSAITYTVRKLETDLDLRLFDRSGHRARLTPAGTELLREGRKLLEAAAALEARTQRVASGWEAQLRIAVDHLIDMTGVLELVEHFYTLNSGTRITLAREILGGTWDALVTGRADLALGVSGDLSGTAGYRYRSLGHTELVFAVAPNHPLATQKEPLRTADIEQYRGVAVADSSRQLAGRSAGLLSNVDVLTVAGMRDKLLVQQRGTGVGHLPRWVAQPQVDAGTLAIRQTERGPQRTELFAAWRREHEGKALRWFTEQLPDVKKPGSDPSFG